VMRPERSIRTSDLTRERRGSAAGLFDPHKEKRRLKAPFSVWGWG